MENKSNSTSNQSPEKLVLDFFDRVWHNPHELDAIDELMTEDYVITTAGKEVKGRNEFKKWVGEFQKQLLDAKTESIDVFSMQRKIELFQDGTVPEGTMGFLALNQMTDLFHFQALRYGQLRIIDFQNVG